MSGRKQWNKQAATSSFLDKKTPQSLIQQGLEGSTVVGKDEVGGSNPPSSSTKHLKSSDFRCFFVADLHFLREEKCGSTVCPACGNVRKGLKRTGQEVLLPTRCAFSFPCRFFLHDLLHKGAHGLSSLVLLLLRSVGIGAEGEACVVVARHAGHGPHMHAVLQGCSGEGMTQTVVQPVVLRPLQHRLEPLPDGGWVQRRVLLDGEGNIHRGWLAFLQALSTRSTRAGRSTVRLPALGGDATSSPLTR